MALPTFILIGYLNNSVKWARLHNSDIYRMKTKIYTNVSTFVATGVALHVSTLPRSSSGESQEYSKYVCEFSYFRRNSIHKHSLNILVTRLMMI
jgi:hypothetical protein